MNLQIDKLNYKADNAVMTQIYNGHDLRTQGDELNLYDVGMELGYSRKNKLGVFYLRLDRLYRDCINIGINGVPSLDTDFTTEFCESFYITESEFYDLCFEAKTEKAKPFRKWVTNELLPEIRKQSGLEAFQAWRMLDKEHQKGCMERIKQSKKDADAVDYTKANSVVNKITSTLYGYDKSIKKGDMTPEMLVTRQYILSDYEKLFSVIPDNKQVNMMLKNKYLQKQKAC